MIQNNQNLWVDDGIEWFQNLLDSHESNLRSYCRFSLRDYHKADDIVQDVFILSFERQNLLMSLPTPKVRSWLYGVAKNLLRAHFRQMRRRKELGLPEFDLPKHELGPDEIVELRQDCDNAIEKLGTEERIIVQLRIFDHLTFSDIAKILDCKVAACRKRYQRVIYRLRTELGVSQLPPKKHRRRVLSEQTNNNMQQQSENE